ncbi:MAG: DNA primase, partial [Bacteroidota bacterium]|nr:DNA primase [Bacteroidota bacterium]
MHATQIEEVIGDFLHLKKRGANLLGLCPFHDEKTPSFTVSPSKEIFKCFGCGKAGNSVAFIMEHEQFTYPEALRYLAAKYNIEIEETRSEVALEQQTQRESLHIVLAGAQKYFADLMKEDGEGKDVGLAYFKERRLSTATLQDFGLGWSPTGRDTFTQWALKSGYQREYIVNTGLAIETESGVLLDRFRERVMFPIYNLTGKVIGFGGRIVRSNAKEAKYINSPETEVYNKSTALYGLSQAKKVLRQQDSCILVEGYMDVLTMYQAGITNVVASSGTSLTEDQLRLIKRFTNNLTLFFDGDDAGRKAAMRAIDMALSQEMNVKIALLPKEEDPDTFTRDKGTDEIRRYLTENAFGFIQFKTQYLL